MAHERKKGGTREEGRWHKRESKETQRESKEKNEEETAEYEDKEMAERSGKGSDKYEEKCKVTEQRRDLKGTI